MPANTQPLAPPPRDGGGQAVPANTQSPAPCLQVQNWRELRHLLTCHYDRLVVLLCTSTQGSTGADQVRARTLPALLHSIIKRLDE